MTTPLRFLSSLTTSTSLYGNSSRFDPSYTNHVLLRNMLLFSVVGALLTPEKHSLLTSAISWGTVTIVCVMYRRKGDFRDNTSAQWRAGVNRLDKKARRKIILLVGCILLSGISERASEQGWAERESWWAKAALPPIITFLRTYVFGEPGILETSTRPSRKVILLITIVSFFTLLPKYVSTTSYALGLCNIAITSFAYVLFEDVTPTAVDRGDIGQTAIEFDVVVAGGLMTIAVTCTAGFIIAGIFYDSKIIEYGVALQGVWIRAIVAGFVGGAKWLLVPLLVSRFSATSAGSVDLSSALFAGLLYPMPSFTHIIGTVAALGGMLWTYLPLFTKEQYNMASKVSFRPTRSLIGIFMIFILVSSLFIFQQPASVATKNVPKTALAPDFESQKKHPITMLVQEAGNRYEEMKLRQSTTLEAAVKNYKKRYNMNPPPNFDKWYEFAVAKKSVLIDEYDTIHHSLLPLWGTPPHLIRQRARETLGLDEDYGFLRLSVRNGDILEVAGGKRWMKEAALGMIENFKQFLPDMDIAMNTHDEPRVVVPHDELAFLVQKGLEQNKPKTSVANQFSGFPSNIRGKIPLRTDVNRFNEYTRQTIWGPARLSCPLDSPARDVSQEQAPDATDQYALPPLGLIRNRTAFTDVCLQPSLKDRLAFLERPNVVKIVNSLYPIFSQSKLSCFNDILYPSLWYWAGKVVYEEPKDTEWEYKKEQMFWRGSTTGGYSQNGGWKKHHRQHMVKVINGNDTCKIMEQTFATKKWSTVEKKRKDYRDMFDVGFSHVGQCDDVDCAAQEEFFDIKPMSDQHAAWKYKYLIDIDGNAFSGRFYAFLHSHSAVFKVSVFREWHEDWLVPWVHYVPLSLQLDEVVELMRYFMKEKEGQEEIKKIADQGRTWARQVLRKEDFEVWFFRLLLEYGRVIDDNRENIGFIP